MTRISFEDQIAVISASTSGIGLETARLMAEGAARVVIINGRNAQSGAKALEKLEAVAPRKVRFVQADVTKPDEAEKLAAYALSEFGRIDVFVHNGGAQVRPDLFVNIRPEDYQSLIEGHFGSFLNCCRHVVPVMVRQGAGSLVVVASDAGKVATPGETLIGAMKAAAIMLARTLTLEVSRHGVRVNCVTPSLVAETISFDRVMSGDLGRRIFEKATRRARLGLPVPSDVAYAIAFLASPLAARLTGQAVSVNGGISAA